MEVGAIIFVAGLLVAAVWRSGQDREDRLFTVGLVLVLATFALF